MTHVWDLNPSISSQVRKGTAASWGPCWTLEFWVQEVWGCTGSRQDGSPVSTPGGSPGAWLPGGCTSPALSAGLPPPAVWGGGIHLSSQRMRPSQGDLIFTYRHQIPICVFPLSPSGSEYRPQLGTKNGVGKNSVVLTRLVFPGYS